MNKMVKKTLSAALALTIVGGGVPAITGGYDILKPAIVADAAETVTITNGACFHMDDTLDFGAGCYVKSAISQAIYEISGSQAITDSGFDANGNITINSDIIEFTRNYYDDEESTPNSLDNIWGFIVCGDGTDTEPYYFCPLSKKLSEVTYSMASIVLEDSVSLNFYADKPSLTAIGVDSVILEGPNGEIPYTTFEEAGNDNYIFRYSLYATQLDNNVTIQFKKGNDIVKYANEDSFSYKVNDYCDYLIEHEENFGVETANAAKSVKNLGLAADNYFDNTSTEITFLDSDYTDLTTNFAPTFDSSKGKLSLVLDSNFSARLYIDGLLANDKSDDETYTAFSGKDGNACFELNPLVPTDLGSVFNIKYNDVTYAFSALSYCVRALNSSNPKAPDLAKAVYEYYKYVTIYKES